MDFQLWLDGLKFDANGLVPVVTQDLRDGRVLTLAYASRSALEKTRESGLAHFHSRSRASLWKKGETSGNTQRVVRMTRDCDSDAVLYEVLPGGPACHTGEATCFFEPAVGVADGPVAGLSVLRRLYELIERRKSELPPGSYTTELFRDGLSRISQKVGEEGVEVAVAALSQSADRVVDESADLLYHLLVLWSATGVTPEQVMDRLAARGK